MNARIGIGYDAHKLEAGYELWLGGILIEYHKGLVGHSDGDVLIHAIIDSLLGAASMGDIGSHFPPSDFQYQNVSSLTFLEHVSRLLGQHGWHVINVDATIVAEQPTLAPFRSEMQRTIAQGLDILPSIVNIKATTTDGMGFPGRGEGISSYAIASIEQ